MRWLKTLLKRLRRTQTTKSIEDILIVYDDVDMILYKKPVK